MCRLRAPLSRGRMSWMTSTPGKSPPSSGPWNTFRSHPASLLWTGRLTPEEGRGWFTNVGGTETPGLLVPMWRLSTFSRPHMLVEGGRARCGSTPWHPGVGMEAVTLSVLGSRVPGPEPRAAALEPRPRPGPLCAHRAGQGPAACRVCHGELHPRLPGG